MVQSAVALPPAEAHARVEAPRSLVTETQHDDIVVLAPATWADYQRLLEIRGDRAAPRFTYLEGRLELMSPSRSHESIKSMIGRLVEAWCFEFGVDITPYGSWTLEDKAAERGVEPDECYVLGDNLGSARPDLAIEVVWTSGGLSKLDVYRKLGVREVWLWQRERLSVHVLRGASYETVPHSELLPALDLDLLLSFVETYPMTRAVREYRAVLGELGRP